MQILFVCTGNTCRSPMASCMMNALLAKTNLSSISADSAGVSAWNGHPASVQAIEAMERKGLCLAEHRSRMVTQDILNEADWVVCISEGHESVLRSRFARLPHTISFNPAIPDPYGGTTEEYLQCAALMEPQLKHLLKMLKQQMDESSPTR